MGVFLFLSLCNYSKATERILYKKSVLCTPLGLLDAISGGVTSMVPSCSESRLMQAKAVSYCPVASHKRLRKHLERVQWPDVQFSVGSLSGIKANNCIG